MLEIASIKVVELAPNSEGWVSNYDRVKDSHTCCRDIKGTVFLTKDMTKGSKAARQQGNQCLSVRIREKRD